MAFCSSFTSSTGPTKRDVPVSTIASQPPLHRVRPLPTSNLWGKSVISHLNPSQMSIVCLDSALETLASFFSGPNNSY